MERIFNKNSQNIETNLSRTLARKITRPASEGGLGFNPTIRNTIGVICANADAFLRLMDETHTKAYEQRANPIRLTSIIDPEKNFGTDSKDSLQKVTVDGKLSEDSIVYPWPQYFETEVDQNGNSSYVVKYPGDPQSLTKTKGYLNDVWPEVQFVEEYLKGSVQKEIQQSPTGLENPATENEYIGVAAVEFPNSVEPYENLTETNFLYEMLERSILSSNYTKLFRPSSNSDEIYDLLGDFEYHNISEAVKKSTSLTIKLKNFAFTYPTFLSELRQQSVSGEGELWTEYSQGNFVTPYIKNYVDNPNQIYDVSVFQNTPEVTNGSTSTENIEEYLKKTTSNEFTTYDVYPFTNLSWEKQNLANGSKINSTVESNNTTKTLVFNENKKTISSFRIEDNTYDKTLFTSTYWRDNTGQSSTQDILNFNNFTEGSTSQGLNQITRQQAKEYYESKNDETLYVTESFLNYGNEYGTTGITPTQTTSLLNTPYFANAISESAELLRQRVDGQDVFFTSLGYLLVNSLPLATLKEKYKSFNEEGVETELDYVWSVMSKFSSIHRVPYSWILKYGSIWHRYKTYVEDNVDILDSVWTDYNYSGGYDPVNSASTTTYDIRNYTGGTSQLTQQFNTNLTIPTPSDLSLMNIGLYPQLINDTYYFFTEKEVFTGYTSNDWQTAYDKKMYVGKINSGNVTFKVGDIAGQPNRGLYINNFFQYMDLRENADRIGTAIEDKEFFLLPSSGFLPFNQSKFECSNNNNKMVVEMTGNTSVYNGSVRTLWLSSNYGYFNNNLITKPTHTQYLKQIFTGDSKQNAFSLESDVQYSSIEELFSIFDKDTLDKFQTEFLNFCKPLNNGVPTLNGETTTSTFFNVANASDRKYRNIQSVLSEVFSFSGEFNKTSSSDKDSYKLAVSQMDNTVTFMEEFLSYDVVLKLGNVGEFNRRIFGSFVTPSDVTQPIDFGNYVNGTLPGDGSGISLIDSQINNVTEWDTLETYVGFSTISGLTYGDNGSYITDFFIDNNVDFSVQNIQQLSKIIKIYATQKLLNNSITPTQFNLTIQQLLTDQLTFRQTILNNTFTQLRNKLPNYKVSSTTGGLSAVDGNQPKLEIYSTLKTFNDKWIAGGNFKTRTLFEDFLFLDRANRDIGDTFTIDVISLKGYLKGKVASYSLMSLIGYILSQNNFIFMALPSYINFYGIQEASKNGLPTVNPDIANSAFGTFLSVDYQDSRPKFLCMYVGKPSEHLDLKENKNSRFKNDVFDLRRGSNNPLLENQINKVDWSRSNKVVGFNLDFGIRNQNIFKSISLDQNQYKNTSESFQVLSDMANQAAGDKVAQQTTSLYNVYRTRSYTCSVSSMGNMMIQPTMYFNLRHVPMFYGPYFITNVSHDINVNGFETNFEGMRQPIFSFPSIDKLVMSVNKNLLKKYETFYRKKRSEQTAQNATNQNNTSRSNNPLVPSESANCNQSTQFPSLSFVDFENTRIPTNDVITYLNSITNYSKNLRAYSLGVCYLMNTGGYGSFDCTNNNLFGVTSSALRYQNLTGFTNGQVCVQNNSQTSQVNGQSTAPTVPIFSFENKENSIKLFLESYINYVTIIDKLISLSINIVNNDEKLANALTYLYLSTWIKDYGTGKTGSEIKQQTDTNISNGTFTQQQFDDIKEKMLNAVVKIL